MKIIKSQLKQIIKEEIQTVMEDVELPDFINKLGYRSSKEDVQAAYDTLTDEEKAQVDSPDAMYDKVAMIRRMYHKRATDPMHSKGADQKEQWMKILKDKYIDVPTIGKGEHAEYAGKQLPGGQLAVRMDHEIASELEAAGTPVPEDFIKQVRQKLVPQDLETHRGPEPGSDEWNRTRKGSGPSRKYDDSHRAFPGRAGTAHMGYGESMKITRTKLKQIIREEIAEARLPDTMKAGYGDPQDDEREDAMGPRVPHEFSLTQKWEEDLAGYILDLKDEQQRLNRHIKKGNRYARNLDPAYHMVISRLKSMQSDLGRELPVRRHGQGVPIDPTKYVEAPSKMEQDQIEKAVGLVQDAFVTMARGQPVDHIQLKKDIQSAMPYGSRDYWSVKGGKSKTGGGYEYDPEMDTPTYFENLQKTIREELETVLDEEENNPWAICTAQVGREDKEKYEKCVKSVKKQNRSK